ncbi:MAG: hypothetical protein IK115_06405 [Lachnospiraceae bacterium]|nr:hypothetical protein [Lachnospiraceae bacterium]
MRVRNTRIQVSINIIALVESVFYWALAIWYFIEMHRIIHDRVKLGFLALIPMIIYLPIILEGCVIPVIRGIALRFGVSALSAMQAGRMVTDKLEKARKLFVADAVMTIQVLLMHSLAFVVVYGDPLSKALTLQVGEEAAWLLIFGGLFTAFLLILARMIPGLILAYKNVNDSKEDILRY